MPPFNPLAATGLLFESPEAEPSIFRGTCFAFRRSTHLLTPRHCVSGAQHPLAVFMTHPGTWRAVQKVETHPTADVAILVVEERDGESFRSFVSNYTVGEDFIAYGFPENVIGDDPWLPTPRIFKGHFQRFFSYRTFDGYEYPAAELNIPAPAGLSGGPLFRAGAPSV